MPLARYPKYVIDLHTHSTASDGTDSPAQLVANAKAAGVTTLGTTDHDTIAGWDEAAEAAQANGINLVRGTEISTTMGWRSLHLLSYLHDPTHPALLTALKRTQDSRLERLQKMTALLAADYPITWDSVCAQIEPGASVGRPHIADALVAAGVVPDRDAAFATMLKPGSPYYIRYQAPQTVAIITAVRAAGGVPVAAHPFAARYAQLSDDDFATLAAAGLLGIEVWHREHTAGGRAHALRLSHQLGLLPTGSSDYHGTGKPNRLGENFTTPEVLEKIAALGALPIV